MKPPPFLLGAALIFWGWQTGHLPVAFGLAVVLESARYVRVRWELVDEDFTRIWVFCTVLVLISAVYSFTSSGGPESFRGLINDPNFRNQANAGHSSARTAVMLLRSLPMALFLFVAAQIYSTREGISLTMISLILRRRWLRAQRLGQPLPALRVTHLGYPYFAICLFGASAHGGENITFFFGSWVLLAWALWPRRSHRFAVGVWAAVILAGGAAGFAGQRGVIQFERFLESYNPQWLSAAARRGSDPQQSQTEIGQIGRIKNSAKIVVRLETPPHVPPPDYLREASYRRYKSPVWYAGNARDAFVNIAPDPDLTTWVLQPGVTKPNTVNLACYLDPKGSLLPLPPGAARLEHLPAFTLQENPAGAVFATGPGLVIFDARYGPGATLDSPNTADDLDVPPREVEALEYIIDELHLRGTDPARPELALGVISDFFQGRFKYSMRLTDGKRPYLNDTPLGRFLRVTRSGHCEYFATATVLLLRELKIPARYAVGYYVHEGDGTKYVVRQRDAHAWCLVWSEREQAWRDFDTTPGSWVAHEAERASLFQFLGDAWSRLLFEFSKFRWGQANLRQYLLWFLIPALLLLLAQILFRGGRRRRVGQGIAADAAGIWPGLDSEFYQLADGLAARGTPRQPGESVIAWLRRAASDPALADLTPVLQELARLHYRYRFDPQGLAPADRRRLADEARACLARLAIPQPQSG